MAQIAEPTNSNKGCSRVTEVVRILIKCTGQNRYCAWLPQGFKLVSSSRQPLLDSARVLLDLGYLPDIWVEMWRPGAAQFAMRAVLGVAAQLTVDETRTIFAPWRPFPSSAVAPSERFSETAPTTPAEHIETPPCAALYEPDPPEKGRRPHTGSARALSFSNEAAASRHYAETPPTSSREEQPASLNRVSARSR
jgi:hypothetical protein